MIYSEEILLSVSEKLGLADLCQGYIEEHRKLWERYLLLRDAITDFNYGREKNKLIRKYSALFDAISDYEDALLLGKRGKHQKTVRNRNVPKRKSKLV